MSDYITDFIDNSVNDKPVKAFNSFSAEIDNRVVDALDAKREEILQKVFNPVEEEDFEYETEEDQ